MSLAKLTYETLFGLNVDKTPNAADANALLRFSLSTKRMASMGQASMHIGQRIHNEDVFFAFPSIISGRFVGQASLHFPQPTHFDASISNPIVLCCRIFPSLGEQPMPKFFMAPPNPLSSCPLQCETTTMASASAIAPDTSISFKMPLVF